MFEHPGSFRGNELKGAQVLKSKCAPRALELVEFRDDIERVQLDDQSFCVDPNGHKSSHIQPLTESRLPQNPKNCLARRGVHVTGEARSAE
jgi:hypothetical protein